ncbi:hypothetical protein [Burkholderia ubonensis]|uniref:hypothetical protein n=1 Tax=Burkholderia ubonensis TaxID=101571 RepID=UPI00117799A7|nr:hypothetical protein [Burkholderia ubonensis]
MKRKDSRRIGIPSTAKEATTENHEWKFQKQHKSEIRLSFNAFIMLPFTTRGQEIMSFHINLSTLNLDAETSARISSKISSVILAEIAHLDLSETTAIIGKLGPGTRGIIAIKNLNNLADIATHEAVQNL